ncbi:uncharacterized protein PHALS_07247 [Plasmopara halstedii]|uniref:Uncharacterized protein n=1 Tax=Plasmopara halstedii TaxID=4781 RepID=A0A0P1B5M4_PLAHL|nr:uncharacterized protein PHALS_07247 [Plasmopara halstedii]CEG49484.1 hypothetical protein PHALS_07247 [Plasmopara halstedii]|eukprot:XP_024585853.1 hypothetical protein PHALS_07247 [Plasmopara halstedii]
MKPTGLVVCELECEVEDPYSLVYHFPVSPNCYDILRDKGFDSTLPPDIDLQAGEQDGDDDGMVTPVSGFTASSDLLPYEEEARTLKRVSTLAHEVEQVLIEEVRHVIDEFIEQDVLRMTSHEDVLVAIQA